MRFHRRGSISFISLLLTLSFAGCYWTKLLVGPNWSENYALQSAGATASVPAINDGKYDTYGVVQPGDKPRTFTITLPRPREIRRIVIYNGNLYWFDIKFWDDRSKTWRTAVVVRRRKRSAFRGAQEKYDFRQVRFTTDKILIYVRKTVNDGVIERVNPRPGDKVIGRTFKRIFDTPIQVYRILVEKPAYVREVELYGLAGRE
ncbi:TPA: hypothetical protein EYP37_13265 [Candidatus Poribacteria bacterium]|nr:hypothetical protein [Candidatus Poribacteria bacterium]